MEKFPAPTRLAFALLAFIVVLLASLPSESNAASSVDTLDSSFGKNCTVQLHCGTSGLLCLDGFCQYCYEDAQCKRNSLSLYQCRPTQLNSTLMWLEAPDLVNLTLSYGTCAHKPLVKPFHWRDAVTSFVLFLGSCIASGAGVGGGGLNVAALVFLGDFSTVAAVPLSSVMIGGAAVANFIHGLRNQRLAAPRPLIDYHTTLLLQPLMLGGSIIGILLNRILPDWLTLLIMVITLSYTLYTMGLKFIKTWRADRLAASSSVSALPPADDSTQNGSEIGSQIGASKSHDHESRGDSNDANSVQLDSLEFYTDENGDKVPVNAKRDAQRGELEKYEQSIAWGKIGICFAILIAITLHAILIGGKGGKSIAGIETCSKSYWWLMVLPFPFLLIGSWYIGRRMVKRYELKLLCAFNFLESDILWDAAKTRYAVAVGMFAGCLSSLLGVGVGMLVNPLLLGMGVSPDVSAATSSLMILFTSLSAIAQYGILGRIQWDYAGYLFVLGLLGSVIGQYVLGRIVRKYKSQSYIILAMLLIVFPGGILLVTTAITGLTANIKAGVGVGLKPMCPI